MPKQCYNHDELRRRVCVGCLRPGCERVVPEHYIGAIKSQVFKDFDPNDDSFPNGLCDKCRSKLRRNQVITDPPNYANLQFGFRLKRGEAMCSCYICCYGRAKDFSRGGQSSSTADVLKICSKCFAQVYVGMNHECFLGHRTDNLLSWLPSDVVQQLAATVIDDQMKASRSGDGDSTKVVLKRKRGPSMSLDLSLQLGSRPSTRFSFEDLDCIRRKLKLQNRGVLDLSQALRHISQNRQIIPPGYKEHLIAMTREADDFLTVSKIQIKEKNDDGAIVDKLIDCVHVMDTQEKINHLMEVRGILPENCLVKVLGDTGGDFFKVSLSCIDLSKYGNLEQQPHHRSLFSEELFADANSDNGVNRLQLIGICQKSKEDYDLVSQVLKLLKLENITVRWIATGDQKYINIILGLGAAASTFPCAMCLVNKHDLGDDDVVSELRTFGHLREWHRRYLDDGSKNAAAHFNCIRECLLPFPDEMPIILAVPVPELHVTLRSFDHIWKGLSNAWQSSLDTDVDLARNFAVDNFVVPSSYHGGAFTGPKIMKLLSLLDKLDALLPDDLHPYVEALSLLSEVLSTCFTVEGPGNKPYKDLIDRFETSVKKLTVSVTPSLHSIFDHIKDFYELSGLLIGLGLLSEQAGESIHHKFEKEIWNDTFKRDVNHPGFANQLRKGTALWNSRHMK